METLEAKSVAGGEADAMSLDGVSARRERRASAGEREERRAARGGEGRRQAPSRPRAKKISDAARRAREQRSVGRLVIERGRLLQHKPSTCTSRRSARCKASGVAVSVSACERARECARACARAAYVAMTTCRNWQCLMPASDLVSMSAGWSCVDMCST